jgi:recombination DNA repair RAD52 pathway protein
MADLIKKEENQLAPPKTLYTVLNKKTPQKFIKKRLGRAGKQFDYVETGYVIEQLNKAFNNMWDFEIIDKQIGKDKIWVLGKLTVKFITPFGIQTISKSQFGGSDVKKSNGVVIDIGDDLKAAASDALKKCASLLGIAKDVYFKEDYSDDKEKIEEFDKLAKETQPATDKQKHAIKELIKAGKIDFKGNVDNLTMKQASEILLVALKK